MTDTPDPAKVKVQLNVNISWAYMQHLDNLSDRRRTSKSELVRLALEKEYPLEQDVKQMTRDAGATR
jgi:hypothetical protein